MVLGLKIKFALITIILGLKVKIVAKTMFLII